MCKRKASSLLLLQSATCTSFIGHSRSFINIILCIQILCWFGLFTPDVYYQVFIIIGNYKFPTELDNSHILLSSKISFTCMSMLANSHSVNSVPLLTTYCIKKKKHFYLHNKFCQGFVTDSRLKIEFINGIYEVIGDLNLWCVGLASDNLDHHLKGKLSIGSPMFSFL